MQGARSYQAIIRASRGCQAHFLAGQFLAACGVRRVAAGSELLRRRGEAFARDSDTARRQFDVGPRLVERFGAAGIAAEAIRCERDSYIFDFKGTPAEFVDTFRQFYGPTMNAFDAAEKSGRTAELRAELVTLFQSQNQSQYPDTCLIAATFLRVTVQVG